MPPEIEPSAIIARAWEIVSSSISAPSASSTPGTSVRNSSRFRASEAGDGAGKGVGVDIVGRAVAARRNRRDHRDHRRFRQQVEQPPVDLRRLADKTEIDDLFDIGIRIDDCPRRLSAQTTMEPSLPHRPIAQAPSALMVATICLLIEPASTISTTSTVSFVGDPEAALKCAFNAELVQHGTDLRPAAMDDDRIDAGLLEQRHVAGKGLGQARIAHGMAAIFDDDGLPVVTLHEGQRLGDHAVAGSGLGWRRYLMSLVNLARGLGRGIVEQGRR